ncbi:MAG: valyl-tRNA synthetase [Thermomicrobiales bacterium]|nr:valyl-tRNA synthetase [Thermomicrobiales bacterium]
MESTAKGGAVAEALAPAFDPSEVERGLYDRWDEAGYFAPNDREDRPSFVVIMPPPNVTGELHVGHALFVAVQDIMIRWHRMMGDPTLWVPGADHAGIAGQWVVEKLLAAEGLTRHDLGREKFLERVWAYMDSTRGRIREQMRILGASCDWSRFVFTMDPGPSAAVRKVFKRLYDKGLIYRGERLISWCPRCMTALSDLEVVHQDVQGHLWHIAYPVVGGETERRKDGKTEGGTGGAGVIVVATTRPETMLGDTGVAVHPGDERYKHLIGKQVRLPILGRLLPIVADEAVDASFGSGAVKVTPAHDPNDFEIGKRHGLPFLTVMNLDGTMNAEAGPFAGQTVEQARKGVVSRLEQDGALVKVEQHVHAVGHCQRCNTVVQPMLSTQWFVEMGPLAAPAIAAAKDGRLTFVPERFKGVYLNWMENIHDWCISRQLWWGHRIPVWYCRDCGETIVTEEETLLACPGCAGKVEQDPDVLDTWFSSGLWPFSTLGWPNETDDLRRFYPSSVMETGYEILFFWVARMVFFGLEVMGELPFHTVYLHGTVRDAEGAKMSKTKGNVLDPTEITHEYGADALRFALVTQGSPGLDMRLSMQLVESSRNFVNKLWNATRFALRPIGETGIVVGADGPARPEGDLALADRWIVSRLDWITGEVTSLLGNHLYGEAGRQLRDFVWSELCDWYIEAAKVRLRGTDEERKAVAQTLAYVLERTMRLLHPFMPFATEALWQVLPHAGDALIVAPWPEAGERDQAAEDDWAVLMELVAKVRNARAEANVEPGRWIAADVFAGRRRAAFEGARRELGFLARIADDHLRFVDGEPQATEQASVVVASDVVAVLPLAGMVDLDVERARLRRELEAAEGEKTRLKGQLANEGFVSRAPEKVVNGVREKHGLAVEKIEVLRRRLSELGG